MTDPVDEDLLWRTQQLLQPGEIALDGLVVRTAFDGSEETRMHQATVEVGDVIAEHAGLDPADTYVFSGTDDPEFASNQHQGLTFDGDEFVWECQQLLRDGNFDLVFYFERGPDLTDLVAASEAAGYDATPVPGDEPPVEADAA